MYWHSIITFLIWPVTIVISYWLVRLFLKKMEQAEGRQDKKPV